ncbi:MAG: hypothetical protein MCSN_0770 [Candidatus Microsyncoccus archaeolyticus]|nr:MAG: hypothetical protein MCSN_0770 [Candidatus Parcubacteria bacterium]
MKNLGKIFLLIIFLATSFYFNKIILDFNEVSAATIKTIGATIKITICGNNIKETGEDCDNSDLAGKTCQSFGYTQGTLSCLPSCDFNFTNCSRGEGGGGGGGGFIPPPQTAVVIQGRAYPQSTVVILKDGQLAVETIAGPDAYFSTQISGLSAGNYTFSVYGEDSQGRSSTPFVFPISITQGTTTTISGIFIAPTIAVDKSEVKLGDNIAIFGQAAPSSEITIAVNSESEIFTKVNSDKNGIYLYNFDTSVLEKGQHYTKSKAALNGDITDFSKEVGFIVGNNNVYAGTQKKSLKADVNYDLKVNLVDFSIAAYWYKRNLSEPFKIIEKDKLNGDGKVDLIDFSIIAYYWTG